MRPTNWQTDATRPVVVLDPGDVGHGPARSLGRLGVPVFGVHADLSAPGAQSRYWAANYHWDFANERPEAFAEWLVTLGQRLGDDPILLPTDDATCLFVADYPAQLKDVFTFPDQRSGLARSLSSKESMYLVCKEHGIPTPETRFPTSRKEVASIGDENIYPLLLKAIYTFALKDPDGPRMAVVNSSQELLAAYDRMENPAQRNMMVQEYIPGGSEHVWMFNGYFDGDSNCLFGVTGQKLRQYPAYTGRTSLGICRENREFQEQVTGFMKAIGYQGILDIGYKLDPRSGKYLLLDVNPRVGMSFRLFVDSAGMDAVRAMYLDLTGQSVVPGSVLEGRKWWVEDIDLASSYRYLRDRRINVRNWFRSFAGIQETCWFARDDLRPFFRRATRVLRPEKEPGPQHMDAGSTEGARLGKGIVTK